MPDRTRRPAAASRLASLALLVAGVAGCTGGSEPVAQPASPAPRPTPRKAASKPIEPVPAWVTELPRAGGGSVFFRNWVEGYYSNPQDAFDEAERRALADVVNTIAVHVSSEVVVAEDMDTQQVSSQVRTWASEFVRKDPNREEYHWKDKRRYYVLISVPRGICEPTAENLARFIRKQYLAYLSEGKDRKALDSLRTLVRLDGGAAGKLLLFDFLRDTERWTEAKELAEVLVVELEPGSKERARVRRLLPLVSERSAKEPEERAAKKRRRLAGMRVGVAALRGRDLHSELESHIVGALRRDGVKAEGVSAGLASLTVRGMTENVDQVRGSVGRTSAGEDFTHVAIGQVEVLWLMKKKLKGGFIDYYVAFVSGAFIDLGSGEVLESFVRDAVAKAGVRGGVDLDARTLKCRESLGGKSAASLAGKLPRLVREYVERR